MSQEPPATLHGTAIALGEVAALIRGASGSGKSDLALRCMATPLGNLVRQPVLLVADDRVVVRREADMIYVSAPEILRGKLEVRSLGIVDVPAKASARLALVVDLVMPAALERMPERHHCLIDGVSVRHLALDPREPSAPLKLLLCLQQESSERP